MPCKLKRQNHQILCSFVARTEQILQQLMRERFLVRVALPTPNWAATKTGTHRRFWGSLNFFPCRYYLCPMPDTFAFLSPPLKVAPEPWTCWRGEVIEHFAALHPGNGPLPVKVEPHTRSGSDFAPTVANVVLLRSRWMWMAFVRWHRQWWAPDTSILGVKTLGLGTTTSDTKVEWPHARKLSREKIGYASRSRD